MFGHVEPKDNSCSLPRGCNIVAPFLFLFELTYLDKRYTICRVFEPREAV